MARAKEPPTQVGGQISPYVQQSLQQSKQQSQSRLLTAMQEAGATERAQIAAQPRGSQYGSDIASQRAALAAQKEMSDKRAAEEEKARREDRKFTLAMQEASREFQTKQAELDREQQKAIIAGDRKYKDEIEKRREALRRFNTELNMDAQERNTNAMLSILKGSLQRESSMEKAKTVLYEESEKFDKDKDIYNKTKERVTKAVVYDKRMDLPVRGEMATRAVPAGSPMGFSAGFTRTPAGIKPGTQADPMGVLQDQISKYGGNISVEEMAPANIHKIEAQIQEGKIKTEDINKSIGAVEGMLEAVNRKRKSSDKKSEDFDFWHDTYLTISQMRDSLESLSNSTKKIAGSKTETVGARVRYALGTVNDSSLGGRAARMRDLVGGDFGAVFEEMTKSMQVPKLYEITEDMNEYDAEYRTWFNNYLSSRYPDLQGVE